jgi:hypothetical protein
MIYKRRSRKRDTLTIIQDCKNSFFNTTPVINSNRSDVVAMAREEIALPVKSDSSKRPSKLSKSEPIIPLVNWT